MGEKRRTEGREGEHDARKRKRNEGPAPALPRADDPGHDLAENEAAAHGGADGRGHVGAGAAGKHVAEERVEDGNHPGHSSAAQGAQEEQLPVLIDPNDEQRGDLGRKHGGDEQVPPVHRVREGAMDEGEGDTQQPERRVHVAAQPRVPLARIESEITRDRRQVRRHHIHAAVEEGRGQHQMRDRVGPQPGRHVRPTP